MDDESINRHSWSSLRLLDDDVTGLGRVEKRQQSAVRYTIPTRHCVRGNINECRDCRAGRALGCGPFLKGITSDLIMGTLPSCRSGCKKLPAFDFNIYERARISSIHSFQRNHDCSRLDEAPAHGRVCRHLHLCVGRLRYVPCRVAHRISSCVICSFAHMKIPIVIDTTCFFRCARSFPHHKNLSFMNRGK